MNAADRARLYRLAAVTVEAQSQAIEMMQRKVEILASAALYAANRLAADRCQPQVEADLRVALAEARCKSRSADDPRQV